MASADDRSRHHSVADERGNPFVTFSRLVDQQMSSLFRSLMDFPFASSRAGSAISTSSHDALAEQQRKWRAEAEDFERSLNEFFGQHQEKKAEDEGRRRREMQNMRDFYTQQSLQNRPQGQQQETGNESAEACRFVDCVREGLSQESTGNESEERPQRCPYDLPLRGPYRPESEDVSKNSDTSNTWSIIPFWREPGAPPLVNYLGENPYSPLHLEDRHPFCEHGAKWRKAFADLLAMQHGVVTPCQDDHMSKENWMLALPLYLGGQQALSEENATRQPEDDAEEDAPTELDLYKHLLGAQSPRATSSTSSQTVTSHTGERDASGQPGVISTMTTTQRTTRPDGSVYTQVVLKKRFSDGREESTETEHTTHGTQQSSESRRQITQQPKETVSTSTPSLGHDGRVKQAIGQKIEEKKRNGWFWS
ncbi:MAG: hypothetical protein Q9166_006977 [cf. Caloplaca sp. 2 TL-2023]